MPAHVVTPLETMESWDEDTQLLARKQIGHIIAIVQDSQARLGISTELTPFSQPINNRSNVLNSMRVCSWNVPKNGEEATSLRPLWGTNLPKFQLVPLNVTNSGYRTPTTV